MAIICLEGPSAVGKTTTSAALAEQGNTYVVSEIAELYGPPPAELGGWDRTQWLLDRQVFRWETAARMSSSHELVVFDSDPIKLYYRWLTENDRSVWNREYSFHREMVLNHKLGFADRYYVLTANEDRLRERKEGDSIRTRGNFEKHVKMIEPLNLNYEAIDEISPGLVRILKASSVEETTAEIISDYVDPNPGCFSVHLLEEMKGWMERNPVEPL